MNPITTQNPASDAQAKELTAAALQPTRWSAKVNLRSAGVSEMNPITTQNPASDAQAKELTAAALQRPAGAAKVNLRSAGVSER